MAGELAWTLNLDDDDDAVMITAGAAGPVVADGSEIRGLDPTDGSTRWVYSHPNAKLLDLGHPWHSGPENPPRQGGRRWQSAPDR